MRIHLQSSGVVRKLIEHFDQVIAQGLRRIVFDRPYRRRFEVPNRGIVHLCNKENLKIHTTGNKTKLPTGFVGRMSSAGASAFAFPFSGFALGASTGRLPSRTVDARVLPPGWVEGRPPRARALAFMTTLVVGRRTGLARRLMVRGAGGRLGEES